MITLYDNLSSGNGYKVRLLLSHLSVEFNRVEIDTYAGATHTDEFLALNPNGRIPTVQFDDGRCLAESNAILYYFGRDTIYFPFDLWQQSETLKWMFFEQYSHEPFIAVARSLHKDQRVSEEDRQSRLPNLIERGHGALSVMESALNDVDWFSGDRYGIADISLYAYTHVAPEGGLALDDYPAIRGWLDRVANQDGHRRIETE